MSDRISIAELRLLSDQTDRPELEAGQLDALVEAVEAARGVADMLALPRDRELSPARWDLNEALRRFDFGDAT